jgi:hypothetical protein
MKRVVKRFTTALLVMPALSKDALAHALAQRYDLPLPLGYFLAGCGAAVVMTFIVMVLFFRKHGKPATASDHVVLGATVPNVLVAILQALVVAAVSLLVVAGLFGNPNTFKNITPVAVWVIWWVGFGFIAAFIGNMWPLINPWTIIFDLAEKLTRRWLNGLSLRPHYPRWLGAWPSCVLFLFFAWLELVAPARDVPRNIAIAILVYSLFTWTGFIVFGRDVWIKNGEVFSLAFGLFGRFAPLNFSHDDRYRVSIRPFAAGLLTRRPLSTSMTAFALLMLGTVTVDGFMETPQWAAVVNWALDGSSPDVNQWLYLIMQTALLIAGPMTLAGLYIVVTAVMARATRAKLKEMAGLFVLSLVPIAIAYHLAHYFSLFAIAGQFIIPLTSDPFGYGWDLFGTTLYRIDIGVVDAKSIWYLSVVAIVTGHMVAVWVGHATAIATFGDVRTAARSQYPMLVLMVGYTMLSLWILAQPIVESSTK